MKQSKRYRVYGLGLLASVAVVIAACSNSTSPNTAERTLPQLGMRSADGTIVKSRAIVQLTMDSSGRVARVQVEPTPGPSSSATQPIEVTNAANTSMTIDSSGWITPTAENGMLDFGTLAIATLTDNNLSLCGVNSDEHCGFAMVRAYTIGKPGPGVWNDAGAYGMPLTAALEGTAPNGDVGLDPAGAVLLQSIEIPASQHVLRLSDFIPAPRYEVKSDFTDAGAGTYSATLVIEYVVASTVVVPTPNPTVSPIPVPTVSPTPVPTVSPEPVPTVSPEPVPTVSPEPAPIRR